MTSDDAFNLIIRESYLLLAALTIFGLIRRRDAAHLDIALPFNALALSISIPVIQQATGFSASWFSLVGTLVILTLPYLFMRLLKHFSTVPPAIEYAAIVGIVISAVAVIVVPTPFPTALSLSVAGYFVLTMCYSVFGFIRGALVTRGVTRSQLFLVAAGTGLFALIILLAGIGVVLPSALITVTPLVRIGAVLSGLSFYLGFASPRWLRGIWQRAELYRFLQGAYHQSGIDQISDSISYLQESAARAVGGLAAEVSLWDAPTQNLVVQQSDRESASISLPVDQDDVVGLAWRRRKPIASVKPAEFGQVCAERATALGAKALYVVPLFYANESSGLLVIYLRGALFPDDDLYLLMLFGGQTSRTLRYLSLINDLRYQGELLRGVTDVIIGTNRDFEIQSWNKAAEDTYGWKAEEVIGKKIADVLKTRFMTGNREQLIQQLEEKGVWQGELLHSHKEGREIYVLASSSALRDGNGNKLGYVSVGRDITQRRRAEDALRYERDLMQALLDNLPYMIYFKDTESRFIRVNGVQATLLGADNPEAVIGKTDFDYQRDEISTVSRAEEDSIIKTGQKVIDRVEFNPTRDGQPRWITSTKAPITDAEGKTYGLVGISRDITEEKQIQDTIKELNDTLSERAEQLQAANKELEAFSYSVSHDLRAPLRTVDGFSRILIDDYGPQLPEDAQRYLALVRQGAQQMGQLIDDLLSFSRLGRQPLKRQVVNPADLVSRILEELEAAKDGRQVEVIVGELPSFQGDPSLLKQVYFNLIANAFKFTRKRDTAKIEVAADTSNGETVYFVRDNGTGFDMKYVDKLFGVFQRLHRSEDFEGTGVGLATVQRIIHRHGGRIWAEAAPDKGATFYFTIGGHESDDG